jgi:hypothetical protein
VNWNDVLVETAEATHALPAAVDRLLERARDWPLWREGHDALGGIEVRTLGNGPDRVMVQHNPARRNSVHAAVDAASVAARPCFLCPSSFPPGEVGVAWRDLALLPNPFPIVTRHLTVPTLEHRPQALAGRAAELVELAEALAESMVVLYNGPRCGASAPDHFHFQAGTADLPAFDLAPAGGADTQPIESCGRRFVAFHDGDAVRLGARIEAALVAWGEASGAGDEEPMCNVLVRWRGGRGTALFFPRRRHRPSAFFAGPELRIGVSPAAIEMAGILVVSDHESLDRLDAAAARTVYEDVSPTADQFATFLESIT